MVGYQGEKMSKSKGNLVFVSKLIEKGVDPLVIRWALLSSHYQSYREWDDNLLNQSKLEVDVVREALSKSEVIHPDKYLEKVVNALAENLDTPLALQSILEWANLSIKAQGSNNISNGSGEMARGLDALLGLAF
jgi:L-cysteine:1D-myo-inositol 2-amino-2-deoxy-alpha-D-glucopyranoside ligase